MRSLSASLFKEMSNRLYHPIPIGGGGFEELSKQKALLHSSLTETKPLFIAITTASVRALASSLLKIEET